MTVFLNLRAIAGMVIVAAFFSVATSAMAQTEKNDDAIEQLLARFRKEREEADWPYDKLVTHSDAIVIATFDSRRVTEVTLPTDEFANENTKSCVVSKLNIVGVLKGDLESEQIQVIHLKWKRPVLMPRNHRFLIFQSRMPLPNVVPVTDGTHRVSKRVHDTPLTKGFLQSR